MTTPHQALTALVYGFSKVGKSLFSVSTPAPRVYLDVESAARFLPIRAVVWDPRDPPPEWNKDVGWDTCVVSVRYWEDAVAALGWLTKYPHPFKSLILDSVSELQARNVNSIAGTEAPQRDQWGQVLRQVRGFMNDLRDLTMHPTYPLSAVVVTAMAKQDIKTGYIHPYLQGQLADIIPYVMDLTGYLTVDTDKDGKEMRVLHTRRSNAWEAGERVGGRIPPAYKLAQVYGDTPAEIAKRNTSFRQMMRAVFAGSGGGAIEPPAKREEKAAAELPTWQQVPQLDGPVAAVATATEEIAV